MNDIEMFRDAPAVYQIRLKGILSTDWSRWFDGMDVTHDDEGNTLLTGPVVDQPALHGLLSKVQALGISLLAVNCIAEL